MNKQPHAPRGPQHTNGRHPPLPPPADEPDDRPIRAPRVSDHVQYCTTLHYGQTGGGLVVRAATVTAVFDDDVVDLYIFPQYGEPAHAHTVHRSPEPKLGYWHWPIDLPTEPHTPWPI